MPLVGHSRLPAIFTAAEAAPVTTANAHHIQTGRFARNFTIGPSTTSMVLTWPASKHHGPTCVGEAGGNVLKIGYVKVCTDNNHGTILESGFRVPFSKSVVFSSPRPIFISSIDIIGWSATISAPLRNFAGR
jgi:hypothetical protein